MTHNPGFLKLVERVKHTIRECTVADVKAKCDRGEQFHFVDVREESEFAADRAKGARHIGRGVLERDIEGLIPNKQAEIILYCGGGFRSALAADSLGQMGYTNVTSMEGGIRAWRTAGYAIESASQATSTARAGG
ncbi:MAG: rhodanese-like domain-containing protein [Nitrospira sp.]